MKRFCFLAVLIALSSSAHAGRSISFSIGSHRVHIESSRHCHSLSCARMSITRSRDWRRKRDRDDDERDAAVPAKPVPPPAPQTISPPAPPATKAPAQTIVAAPPPAVYTQAASRTHIVAAPPPPPPPAPPPVQQLSIPVPPPPPARETGRDRAASAAGRARLASDRGRAVRYSDRRLADRRQGNGADRQMRQCAVRLRARFIEREGRSDPDQHEAEDGKAMDRRRLQPGLGETYYGTMSMKGINTLRVEACALGRFYCSGNNWSRITRRADSLVTARQVSAEQRS